jgi:hypothetical protein
MQVIWGKRQEKFRIFGKHSGDSHGPATAGSRAPNSALARTMPPRAENSGASVMSSGRISILTER